MKDYLIPEEKIRYSYDSVELDSAITIIKDNINKAKIINNITDENFKEKVRTTLIENFIKHSIKNMLCSAPELDYWLLKRNFFVESWWLRFDAIETIEDLEVNITFYYNHKSDPKATIVINGFRVKNRKNDL